MNEFLQRHKNRLPGLLAAALIILYIAVFCYLSIVRYLSFSSHYYDLGIIDQVVFNTSEGRLLSMTDPDIAHNISRFSVHFDPLLVAIAPLYMISPNPINLLVVQTVVLAMGGIAVYLIAKKVLKRSWEPVLFVFLYLNYYPLQLTNLFDFHAVALATTSLLFAYYFLALHPFRRKWLNYMSGAVFVIITMLAKENASVVVAFLCAYPYFIQKRRNPFYLLTILVSMGVFVFLVFRLIPYFRMTSPFALQYFDFHNPIGLIQRFFSYDTYLYIFKLLTPVGFISLLSPVHLLIATPELLINLLSSNSNLREMHYHYTAMITPFVIISAIYGYLRLRSFIVEPVKLRYAIFILIFFSVGSNFVMGLTKHPVGKIDKAELAEVMYWRTQLQDRDIRISTTGSIAPFFTERRKYYYFLFDPAYHNMGRQAKDVLKQMTNYKKAEYVIIRDDDVSSTDPLIQAYYHRLRDDNDYEMISNQHGIKVFESYAAPVRILQPR